MTILVIRTTWFCGYVLAIVFVAIGFCRRVHSAHRCVRTDHIIVDKTFRTPSGQMAAKCVSVTCVTRLFFAVLSNVTALFLGYWYFGMQADDVSQHELAASSSLTASGPPVHALSPGVIIAVIMFSYGKPLEWDNTPVQTCQTHLQKSDLSDFYVYSLLTPLP
jgi:hypothetical protein